MLLVDHESMLLLKVIEVTKIGFNYIVGWLWEYVVIKGGWDYWNWVFGIVDWDLLRLVEVIDIC